MNTENSFIRFLRTHIFTLAALIFILILFLFSRNTTANPGKSDNASDSKVTSVEDTVDIASTNFIADPQTSTDN